MSEKQKNPHEVSLGRFLRAPERPIRTDGYWTDNGFTLRRDLSPRVNRRRLKALHPAKRIKEPALPRRSWADIQAAWSKRQREAVDVRLRAVTGQVMQLNREARGE